MTYQSLLKELRELQKLNNNWYSVAVIISRVKEAAAGSAFPSRRLREASDCCGYSPNTLNRMIVVKDFFDAVKDTLPELHDTDPNFLPFTTLEVVKRLHQVDPQQGIQMLLEVVAGKMTIRKLRERYAATVAEKTDVASAHQTARFEWKEFEDTAIKAVIGSSDRLFDEPFGLYIEPHSFPLRVVGFRLTDDRSRSDLGFDFFLMRPSEQSTSLDRLLQRTIFNSGFFTRYWVIFASTVGRQRISDFCAIITELNLLSVGVAALPWGEERTGLPSNLEDLEVILAPTRDPSPDWRQKISTVRDLRSSMNRPRGNVS